MKDRTAYKWKKKTWNEKQPVFDCKTKLNTTTEYAWCCDEYGIRENFPTICNMLYTKKPTLIWLLQLLYTHGGDQTISKCILKFILMQNECRTLFTALKKE